MMLSLLLLQALLFAFGAAQMPPPTMSDTFQGSGEVELHGAEQTVFGKFILARDYTRGMGYEKEEYEGGLGPEQQGMVEESVDRFDSNKTYYLRGAPEAPHCIVEDRNFNGVPKFWKWLEYSTYEGTTEIREIEYDTWGTNVGGVRFEFGKPKSNSSIVYFFRRKTTENSVFYSFMDYKLTPDPAVFTIPTECQEGKAFK